ncbi:MAG TPA: CHAT domain-containing protein [Longimicrobiales bacterium]
MIAKASLAAALLAVLQAGAPQDPRGVVARALAAVEGDSVAAVAARWTQRLRRDSTDRAAVLGLATIARLTYDHERAARLYGRLVEGGDRRPDGIAAYARIGRAFALQSRGLTGAADSAFVRAREAARATGDRALEAEALIHLATVRARSRGVAEAEGLLAQARGLIGPADVRLDALHHCGRAAVLRLVRNPEAGAVATAGAELARRAGDRRLRARCLGIVAAELAIHSARLDTALVVYDTVVAEHERARDFAGLAVALQWRGFFERSVGALGAARRDLEQAVAYSAGGRNAPVEAWATANLASLGLQIGDIASADAYARRAIALFETQRDLRGSAYARAIRAELLAAAGSFDEAREEYRATLRVYADAPAPTAELPTHVALAHLAMREGDWAEAERELGRARAVAEANTLPGWAAGLQYHDAALALRRGRPADAIAIIRVALEDLPDWQGDYRFAYRARLAEAYVRLGDLERAAAELSAASDALDSWRASLDHQRLRLLAFQRKEDFSDPDLGVATVIAALASNGRAAAAFHLAERRRARELLDRMVRAAAVLERSGTSRDSAAAARSSAGATAGWQEIAAAIPDERTAVLEFVTGQGGEPTTLFAITRSGLHAEVLPPADTLEDDIARFVALLGAGADAGPLARALHAAVLESALAALPRGADRLVIIPAGPFQRLPFDALVAGDGARLVEHYAVSLAPSATVAARIWKRPAASGAATLLAFADPVLDVPDAAARGPDAAAAGLERSRSISEALAELPRLRASAREARSIARYAPRATVLRRSAASEAWLGQNALTPYRILHFATHALVDDAGTARTGLVLAPGGGEDGFVTPGELARLALDADLVVLAACRTVRGISVRGEGVQGLTAPLLEAGARAVVASRWDVGDAVSAGFMASFYRAMADGLPAGAALRAAKLAALRGGAPVEDWAAYTLVGDPLVRPALELPPSRWPMILAVLAILAAVAAVARGAAGVARRAAGRPRSDPLPGAGAPRAPGPAVRVVDPPTADDSVR